MSKSAPGAPGGRLRRLAPNALLALAALAFTFAVLEIGVRHFVDMELQRPTSIYDVDLTTNLRFLPHHEHTYETSEFTFHVAFNRFGRRDVEWTDAAIADPRNVLFLGDSLVFGNAVEHEWTIPSRLEVALAEAGEPVEVFNFGMPAGAPPGYALLLADALESGFAPRRVVVGLFVGNDFYRNVLTRWTEESLERARKRAAEGESGGGGGGSLLAHSKLLSFLRLRVSQSTRLVGWALTASRLLGISIYDTSGTYVFLRQRTPEQDALFAEVLSYIGAMQDRCEEAGCQLFVVVIPNRIQVENGDDLTGAIYDADRPNRDVLAWCETRSLPCLDLLPILRAEHARSGEPLYYPIDRHLTPHGTDTAARAIAPFLLRHGSAG